jgi:hypothetical protein
MDRETNDLIARQYLSEKNLGLVEPHEFAQWAALQLERGNDTPKVRSLAEKKEAENQSEVEAQFRECIAELGWEVPGKKSALKQYSKSVMQCILEGTIEPYDGCSQLYVNSIYLGHPDYLYNWNYLFWSMEDLSREELNTLIMEEVELSLGIKPAPSSGKSRDAQEQPQSFWGQLKRLLGLR